MSNKHSKETKFATALASFVPETVKRYILQDFDDPSELTAPMSQEFETVALFADVSGFTALTEALSRKGPLGAEEIGFFLNRYLERVVKVIARSGGDVFKFAGDAILVLWPPKVDNQPYTPSELADMVHRAAQCSLSIQEELHEAKLDKGVLLSIKLGIGVGHATVLHVGGEKGRLEYLPAGPSLMQAFQSEKAASAGHTLMSLQAWEMVKNKFEFTPVNDECVRVDSIITPIRNIGIKRTQLRWEVATERLRRYVPAAVIPNLTINQKLWAAELRQITVVFVNLGLNFSKPTEKFETKALERVQKVIAAIQAAVYQYEGSLNKFLVDDKGSTLLVVFGLPPLAHENDPARALLSSLKMHKVMTELNLECSIGATSGLALCGLVGSGTRREYSVIGDLVNLSARLMQAAAGKVLCDKTTYLAARTQKRLVFRALSSIKVKGKSSTVFVYSPVYVRATLRRSPLPTCKITVGRETELQLLRGVVNSLRRSNSEPDTDSDSLPSPRVAFLDGEIGVGKTHVLRELSNNANNEFDAEEERAYFSWGRGDPFSALDQFAVWRYMFVNMTGVGDFYDGSQATIYEMTKKNDIKLVPFLNCINPVLITEFEPTPETQDLTEIEKNAKIFDIVLMLLLAISHQRSLVLVIDECQWKSDCDWLITEQVVKSIQCKKLLKVSIIVSSRPLHIEKYEPMFLSVHPAYNFVRDTADLSLTLGNIDKNAVDKLLQHNCDVKNIDENFVSLVAERTGGRPLFCQKFVVALKHVKALIIDGEACRLSEEWHERGNWDTELPIPYRIQRITATHLDRLTPSQNFVLKVASVIAIGQAQGSRSFAIDIIHHAHPISEYLKGIDDDLDALISLQILKKVEDSYTVNEDGRVIDEVDDDESYRHGVCSYRFSYGFLRDAIYQLMLYKQRQKLHRLVADYIVSHLSDSIDPEKDKMVLDRHYILGVAEMLGSGRTRLDHDHRNSTIIPSSISQLQNGRKFKKNSSKVALLESDRIMEEPSTEQKESWFHRLFSLCTSRNQVIDETMKHTDICTNENEDAGTRNTQSNKDERILSTIPTIDESSSKANSSHTQGTHASSFRLRVSPSNKVAPLPNESRSTRQQSMNILRKLADDINIDETSRAGISFVLNTLSKDDSVWTQAEESRNDSEGESSMRELGTVCEENASLATSYSTTRASLNNQPNRRSLDTFSVDTRTNIELNDSPLRGSEVAFDALLDLSDNDWASLKVAPARAMIDAMHNPDGINPVTRTIGSGKALSLEELDKWDFDIFHIADITDTQPLVVVGYELFLHYDMLKRFNIDQDTLINFLVGIEYGYNRAQNSYHNSIHAADVVQTVHVLLKQLKLVKPAISDTDILAILIASVIHDYRHPGQTNQFLVATEDERAILFNDIHVLENFHCTAAFRFMRHDQNNILRSLSMSERQELRQQVISLVLATSLADHFDFLQQFNINIASGKTPDFTDITVRSLYLKMAVKCADISNACKPHALASRWASGIMDEFYKQGDKERSAGLQVSRFMDRNIPSTAKCQTTFITTMVKPLFNSLAKVCPDFKNTLMTHLDDNLERWKVLEAEENHSDQMENENRKNLKNPTKASTSNKNQSGALRTFNAALTTVKSSPKLSRKSFRQSSFCLGSTLSRKMKRASVDVSPITVINQRRRSKSLQLNSAEAIASIRSFSASKQTVNSNDTAGTKNFNKALPHIDVSTSLSAQEKEASKLEAGHSSLVPS